MTGVAAPTLDARLVDVEVPSAGVGFLRKVLPSKRRAELYTALGLQKQGKTLFYRDLHEHLENSVDSFVAAPGIPELLLAGRERRFLGEFAFPGMTAVPGAITETDIDDVSDRLLDGISAWGDIESIAARVAEYRSEGADQVVLRILGVEDLAAWRTRLAEALIHAG